MKYHHSLITGIAKTIGSIMTIAFSLVAFAHGQSCTLLPGWTPAILADGQSRTWYQVSEATYTQSCTGSVGSITCISWSVAYGNIFKYPSCIPHTRANCTTPTGANHLEYKTLYKLSQATYTQTCQQLSQSLQCLNGIFTWWTTPNLFTHATCTDPNRTQCIDIRTNSYKDHGETLVWYTSWTPTLGQTCTTLQKTLTCTNGVWSWNGSQWQAWLVTWCNDSGSFLWCLNIRTHITVPHGSSINGYTSPTGVCTWLLRPLTCTNGLRNGGNQSTLYSWCTEANTQSCPNIITNSWTIPHWSFITKYTQQFAFVISNHYCTDYAKNLQCINGTRSWNQWWLFTWCQNVESWSCLDIRSNTYVPNFQFIYGYSSNQPTSQSWCAGVRTQFFCKNSQRKNNLATTGSILNQWSYYPTCGNCILPRWTILPEKQLEYVYSTILWSVTGQNYIGWCAPFSGRVQCINSMLQWTGMPWAFTPSNFPYSLQQCEAGQAKNCTEWNWWTINHLQNKIGYSTTWATFPKTCEQNYSSPLTCINGIINGNYQTYQYPTCTDSGWLVPGIDLAIDESPWLAGQENTDGALIAQWSSPQMTILLKNKWTDIINQPNIPTWFITCRRIEQNLDVYKSSPITKFVVNPWTKVWMNIRIKSLFTQALGMKTLSCKINTTLLNGNVVGPGNDTWSWTFEVVQADRFDLALSKSIESISKNLEAAEGAKGTQWVQNFLYNKIMNVLVPLVIILGILSAILWFYKLMFSSDDKATGEWTRYIIFWVIGIILIMSAKFIGQNVFSLLATPESGTIKWYEIASWLYDKILYPFIKLAIYLVLGGMFIILISRVITFLFGSDSDAQKKAWTLIGWNVIAMLVIIWAKQIVQAIYGKQADVVKDITNLWEVWSGVLADKNIPILYQIINYALGIASLVILVIIIIQTVKLLTKPDDPAQIKNIKNSLLYMFIGILILGAGYLIVNFAIIN